MKIRFIACICFSILVFVFGCFNPSCAKKTEKSAPIPYVQNAENKVLADYSNYVEYCIRLSLQKNNVKGVHEFSMKMIVESDGTISAFDIIKSSDDEDYDKKVIDSVVNSAPYKPFPANLNKQDITYQVNVYGGIVDVTSYTTTNVLEFATDQKDKTCETVEINQAKRVRTMNYFPWYVPFSVRSSVAKQIEQNWYPQMQNNNAVGVSFRLYTDGTTDKIEIFKSSNSAAADNVAVDAVKSVKTEPWVSKDKYRQLYAVVKYGFHVEDAND